MKERLRQALWICAATLLLAAVSACVHFPPPPDSRPAPAPQAVSPEAVPERTTSDADLIYEGMQALGEDEQAPDYDRARQAFDALIEDHPNSKWRKLAEKMIVLLNDISDCRRLAEKLRGQKTELAQDNEQLKKDLRGLNEKLQAVVKENEDLKNDIQRLKNIEIELEKRDRLLR